MTTIQAEAGNDDTIDGPVRKFFDRLAPDWNNIAVHPAERIEHVLAALDGLAGSRILDVGCGTGVLLPYLRKRVGPNGKITALDLSPRMIEVAASIHGTEALDYVVADFRTWKGPHAFNAIIAYSCYPHFLEPEEFWRSAAANLASGGQVLVAHIEGRKAINAMHGDKASSVSRDLEPVELLARTAARHGFEGRRMEDSDEYYVFQASFKESGRVR